MLDLVSIVNVASNGLRNSDIKPFKVHKETKFYVKGIKNEIGIELDGDIKNMKLHANLDYTASVHHHHHH